MAKKQLVRFPIDQELLNLAVETARNELQSGNTKLTRSAREFIVAAHRTNCEIDKFEQLADYSDLDNSIEIKVFSAEEEEKLRLENNGKQNIQKELPQEIRTTEGTPTVKAIEGIKAIGNHEIVEIC